jgi:phosphoglycolate phosphatase-like HAD superfamily hydrolase
MQAIKAVLFEPVGCLAEFPAEPFLEMAAELSGRKKQISKSGSRAYWHLLNLMEISDANAIESLEIEAAEGAVLYEDVTPTLSELRSMGIELLIASSLSSRAIERFLEKGRLREYFSSVWCRDNARGVKASPLQCALHEARLQPNQTMFLADTAEGLKVAQSVGVNSILMMNDPDESRRLATHNPSGGIVSLHELPDFIRFVAVKRLCS